jgi:glycosyltransferase involved in cell wall biosynthesis
LAQTRLRRCFYTAQSWQIRAAVRKWVPRFDGIWVTKREDTKYRFTRDASVLRNIPYNTLRQTSPLEVSKSLNPVILTVGVLFYKPNCDGIDRFLSGAWPKIRAACPTAEYWLAGKNDPTIANRWRHVPGVKVLGFVDDVLAVYNACWFTLCPLWAGAGTNIKIVESLAFGLTCVTTNIGQRGYEDCLKSGESLVVASTLDAMAEECIRLIRDNARRTALGQHGREIVQCEFSYETFARVVHREVESALSKYSGSLLHAENKLE